MLQDVTVRDATVLVRPSGRPAEEYRFATAEAAEKRATFVREALSWVGTPFIDCADVKGPNGGVDCAMMLTRAAVDSGLLPPFDPRPYNPRHMMNSSEERFIGWVRDRLGAAEVEEPRLGDLLVYQFGRCFCHGAVLVNGQDVVHAYKAEGFCNMTRRDTPLLTHIGINRFTVPRPVKYFSLFGG